MPFTKCLRRNLSKRYQTPKKIKWKQKRFQETLIKLVKKCIRSNFNPKLVKSQFKKVSEYNSNENLNKLIFFLTKNIYKSFKLKTLLKFKEEEKKLFLLAKTSLTKPRSMGQLLNTLSYIAKKGSNVLLNKS